MKKVISLMLALVMGLSLVGCGSENTAPEETKSTQETEVKIVKETEAEQETDTATYADDMFSAEEIVYRVVNNQFDNFEIKIRNTSDEKLNTIIFTVQGLDKNGDVIESWFMGNNGALDAGQAYPFYCRSNFTDTCASVDDVISQMEYIKIVDVRILKSLNANAQMEQYEFKEAPIFKVADIQPKK